VRQMKNGVLKLAHCHAERSGAGDYRAVKQLDKTAAAPDDLV